MQWSPLRRARCVMRARLILPPSPTAKGANRRVEYFNDYVDLVSDG